MLLNHYFFPKPYLLERLATLCVPYSLSMYVSVYEVVADSATLGTAARHVPLSMGFSRQEY